MDKKTGKWWGSRDKQPILCVHGWQDNANSFDTLIPLLSSEFSYLAIDLPGHGQSSHFPKGVFYKTYESPSIVRRVQQHFNWSKFSLIGHCFGGICGFLYATVFGDDVNFFVAIEAIKPTCKDVDGEMKNGAELVENMLIYDTSAATDDTQYNKDELTKMILQASSNSLTEKSSQILMKRGSTESKGLLKWGQDSRVKKSFLTSFAQPQILDMAERVTCSVLYIKAIDWPYLEDKQKVIDVIKVIKEKAKYFEEHELPGTHHLHLNSPETVAPVINSFMKSITQK